VTKVIKMMLLNFHTPKAAAKHLLLLKKQSQFVQQKANALGVTKYIMIMGVHFCHTLLCCLIQNKSSTISPLIIIN
jgi:hypothetical protein